MSLRPRQTLAAAAVGCAALIAGCKDSGAPDIGPPATLSKRPGGDHQTGTAGEALPNAPSVLVRDANGNAVPNVVVTFAVTAGEGNVERPSATTGADGVASASTWTLGTRAGENSLTATVAALPNAPVTFSAFGRPGPPATLVKEAGDDQTAPVRFAVEVPPTVRVRDRHGNPVPGVAVTFSIVEDGGWVTAAEPNTFVLRLDVPTNGEGLAAVLGWRVSNEPRENRMQASVTGVAPVEFKATAVIPCAIHVPLSIGSSVTGALTNRDCGGNGTAFLSDMYAVTVDGSPPRALEFALTATGFNSHLYLMDAPQARFTEYFATTQLPPARPDVKLRVIAAPRTYSLWVTSYSGPGSYSLSVAPTSEDATGCPIAYYDMPWITRGTSTTQRLEKTDCALPFVNITRWADHFAIFMMPGTYTLTMTAVSPADFRPWLRLRDASNLYLGTPIDAERRTSRVVYRATRNEVMWLQPTSSDLVLEGTYTLTVEATLVPRAPGPGGNVAPSNARRLP